jgi:hypothetical protein
MPLLTKPKIVRPDLDFQNKFGQLGQEVVVTGHHSATPPDRNLAEAIYRVHQFHRDHAAKGWGGLGYHFVLARSGEIILGRPTLLLGAHVGGHNTGNVGVMCIGTVGDVPTRRQKRALRWLLANAHTKAMPRSHRTDRDLRQAKVVGHNDWSGHESNACPGTHKRMYLSRGWRR